MARAASNYRQLRLTFTEEALGRCTWRVQVKPLEHTWMDFVTVESGVFPANTQTHSTEEALMLLLEAFAEGRALPRT